MLNLLKNNLFDYYSRNQTCAGCLIDRIDYGNYNRTFKKFEKFIEESGINCSFCFFRFLQMLEEKDIKSYKKLLKYLVENSDTHNEFPCNGDNKKIKQIILNSIVVGLDIE